MPRALKFFKAISKEEIPLQVNDNRQSIARTLPFWPEFESALRAVKNGESLPHEGMALDIGQFKTETKKLQRPMPTILHAMRKFLASLQIEKKVEIIRRGDNIIVCEGNDFSSRHTGGRRARK